MTTTLLEGLRDSLHSLIRETKKAVRRRRRKTFYFRFLRPGDLAFDVGANLGDRTEMFLRTGARVVCVEPMEACVSALRRKFANNPNVAIVPKGLDEKEGEAVIYYSEEALNVSSMSREWIEAIQGAERLKNPIFNWSQSCVVPVTTLDRLIAEFGEPDFCKMDVEGSELRVLKGLTRPLRMLCFEYTPEYIENTGQCIEHLSRLGDFRYNYSTGESMKLALPIWISAAAMHNRLPRLVRYDIYGDIYARLARP